MFIYNVTIKIQDAIHHEWLQWLKDVHVPEIIATSCFTKATILRLKDIDDREGPTYAIQYFAASRKDYDEYMEKFAVIMRQKSFEKWADKFIAFRSVMEVVN